jgi:hypothetical protein
MFESLLDLLEHFIWLFVDVRLYQSQYSQTSHRNIFDSFETVEAKLL